LYAGLVSARNTRSIVPWGVFSGSREIGCFGSGVGFASLID
jgi:hypothetical protein